MFPMEKVIGLSPVAVITLKRKGLPSLTQKNRGNGRGGMSLRVCPQEPFKEAASRSSGFQTNHRVDRIGSFLWQGDGDALSSLRDG